MPRFNSINSYQNRPEIKLFFAKKCKIFDRRGLLHQTLATVPPLQISGHAPANYYITTLTHITITGNNDVV